MATKTDIELKIVDSVDTSHSVAEVLDDSASNPDAFYVGRGYLAHNGEKVIEGIDPNGTYPNMTVGIAQKAKEAESATHADTATDLSGRVEATPEVFTYRPSAGDKSIKDDNAFIRRVKGNSVVWNQLVKNGDFASAENWVANDKNSITLTIEAGKAVVTSKYAGTGLDAVAIRQTLPTSVANHKYFVSFDFSTNNTALKGHFEYYKAFSGYASLMFRDGDTYSSIFTAKESGATSFLLKPQGTKAVGDVWEWDNVMIIDLTAMFGTGNEPTTVEEFRALYPNSYYPYNTGELRNLVCSGIKTVGFNLCDEDVMTSWQGITKDNRGWYGVTANFYKDSSNNMKKLWVNTMGYTGQICVYIKSTAVDARTNFRPQIYYIDGTTNSYDDSVVLSNEKTSAEGYIVSDENKVVDFVGFSYGNIGYVIVNNFCINLHHTGYRDGEYEPYKEVTHDLPLSQITNGEPLRKAGSVYDEINETEYIRRVGVRGYATGDKDDATLLTDGIYTNYPLDEPIVKPIETPVDFNYYVEDFGTEEAILAENSAPFSADIIYQFNATDQVRNNTRNIQRLQKSVFTPSGTTAQYIRGDGSYADVSELSRVIPINDGEGEGIDLEDGGQNLEFRLFPQYYAKSKHTADADMYKEVIIRVEATDNTDFVAEYWFELEIGESIPQIRFENQDNVGTSFRFNGEIRTDAVNIWHLITTDGGTRFFGEIKNYVV